MLWTTVPSILIALAIFGVIGYTTEFSAPLDLTVVLEAIESIFRVGLLTLIPLLVVLIMSFRRISAFPTILVGALVGGITAVILQPDVVLAFVDDPSLSTPVAMIKGIWSAMATGFAVNSEYEGLNDLFSRGGMSSMLETVWLIISAMAFGGVMEYTGLLAKLIQPLLNYSKTDRSILVSTSLTSIGINLVAGDQYMAIVLPGRMFRKVYPGEKPGSGNALAADRGFRHSNFSVDTLEQLRRLHVCHFRHRHICLPAVLFFQSG